MPDYEYECEKCGRFQLWQSIKDDAIEECPTCKGPVIRIIQASVSFRGLPTPILNPRTRYPKGR